MPRPVEDGSRVNSGGSTGCVSALESAPRPLHHEETNGNTIAARTRTKVSLVDVNIDALESLLPDFNEPNSDLSEDEEAYQRFLASLVPKESDDLSFLLSDDDEEDEEYQPEHDDEHDDNDDHLSRRVVSKRELTDLLLDSKTLLDELEPAASAAASAASTTRRLTPVAPATSAPLTAAAGHQQHLIHQTNTKLPFPLNSSSSRARSSDPASALATKFSRTMPTELPTKLRGSITKDQCIHLASQMHKHMQLLMQSVHALGAATNPTASSPRIASTSKDKRLEEVSEMLRVLQKRGLHAQKCKDALLNRWSHQAASASSNAQVTPVDGANNQLPNDEAGSQLLTRRVTRSLTAAHAAVTHPSMFDLIGVQGIDQIIERFGRQCSVEQRNTTMQSHLLALDGHLIDVPLPSPAIGTAGDRSFSSAEDRLLLEGVRVFDQNDIERCWEQIRSYLLPNKTISSLKQRHRLLVREGAGSSCASSTSASRKKSPHRWLQEEEIRLVRGMIQICSQEDRKKKLFVRLANDFLPHRTRNEVRKRWEKMKKLFVTKNDEANGEKEVVSIQKMEQFVEQQQQQLKMKADSGGRALSEGEQDRQPCKDNKPKSQRKKRTTTRPGASESDCKGTASEPQEIAKCKRHGLHPALFFSPWAILNPGTLLKQTCEHNWPEAVEEGTTGLASLDWTTKAMEDFSSSSGRLGGTLRQEQQRHEQTNSKGEKSDEDDDEDDEEEDYDFEVEELDSSGEEGLDEDDGYDEEEFDDEDDSDDDNEDEDEKEDGDDDNDRDFEQVNLLDEDETESTAKQPIRHTLRLRNLPQTNERMKRALAALERRITGAQNAVSSTTPSQPSLTSSINQRTALQVLVPRLKHKQPVEHHHEQLLSSSDDEDFECEELLSSSSDDDEDSTETQAMEVDDDHPDSAQSPTEEVEEHDDSAETLRAKRQKTHKPCSKCGSIVCNCHAIKMQRLLRRMEPCTSATSSSFSLLDSSSRK